MYEQIKIETENAVRELVEKSKLKKGSLVVVGCSSSEILGEHIGKGSSPETGVVVAEAILKVLNENGIYLAAQCCEHLNRALVVERAAAEKYMLDEVCVRPMPKAGGSFATAVYDRMSDPVMLSMSKLMPAWISAARLSACTLKMLPFLCVCRLRR